MEYWCTQGVHEMYRAVRSCVCEHSKFSESARSSSACMGSAAHAPPSYYGATSHLRRVLGGRPARMLAAPVPLKLT